MKKSDYMGDIKRLWQVMLSTALPTVLSAALLAGGCATVQTTSGGTVGVERSQTMMVSAEQVNKSAEKSYKEVIDEARKNKLLNKNAAQVERVKTISNRLVRETAVFRPDAPSWKWETNVITSDELNAWCMPGGKIAVYPGIIDKLKLTDDELAAVMGHEIAHALREHGREKVSQSTGVGMAAAIGGAIIGSYYGIDAKVSQNVLGTVGDLAFMRPNSRGMEQEADRMGVELAARAGYDPFAAVTLWEKMDKAGGGSPPEWLSTHPSSTSRQADLKVYAERVLPLYQQARKSR